MTGAEDDAGRKDDVKRACLGGGVGNDRGEAVEWRGSDWVLAEWRNDGDHVHLTLTAPRRSHRPAVQDHG